MSLNGQSAPSDSDANGPFSLHFLGYLLGRTRFVVIVAVVAVMLVSISLFLLGTLQAVVSVWSMWRNVAQGKMESMPWTIEFLEIVGIMLKAVIFYLVGIGLYSLFIAPLNVTVALGIETLADLENKLLSVLVVIMGTTFLEHFIRWEKPVATLQQGGAMALVVTSLVLFEALTRRTEHLLQKDHKDLQERARQEMYYTDKELLEIEPEVAAQGVRKKREEQP